jgi:hypothetical protein
VRLITIFWPWAGVLLLLCALNVSYAVRGITLDMRCEGALFTLDCTPGESFRLGPGFFFAYAVFSFLLAFVPFIAIPLVERTS